MEFRIHCSVLEDYFSKMSSMLSETLPLYYKHMLNFLQLSIIICYSSFMFFLLSILGYSLDRQNTIFISDVPIGESLGLSSSVNVMVKKVVKLWSYFPQGKSCFVTLLESLHLRTEKNSILCFTLRSCLSKNVCSVLQWRSGYVVTIGCLPLINKEIPHFFLLLHYVEVTFHCNVEGN
jgi:hypothetical protein